MPKFDKEGNRLLCNLHEDLLIPGQSLKKVSERQCHACRKIYQKKYNDLRQHKVLIARKEQWEKELKFSGTNMGQNNLYYRGGVKELYGGKP